MVQSAWVVASSPYNTFRKKGRGQHCVNRTLSCVAARDLGTSLTCSRHTFLSQLINVEGPGPRMDSGQEGGELLGRLSVS